MEHAMERTLEWDSHGQMEPSSANYGRIQLNPIVTQMKDQALCISLCFLSIHTLFIWKCTPFALVLRSGIQERWPPRGDCVWKKNRAYGAQNITRCNKKKKKCHYFCSHLLLTCSLIKIRTESSGKSLGTLAHASEHVPLARQV